MAAPAQAILFQVATGTPCAFHGQNPKQAKLFSGGRKRVVIYCVVLWIQN